MHMAAAATMARMGRPIRRPYRAVMPRRQWVGPTRYSPFAQRTAIIGAALLAHLPVDAEADAPAPARHGLGRGDPRDSCSGRRCTTCRRSIPACRTRSAPRCAPSRSSVRARAWRRSPPRDRRSRSTTAGRGRNPAPDRRVGDPPALLVISVRWSLTTVQPVGTLPETQLRTSVRAELHLMLRAVMFMPPPLPSGSKSTRTAPQLGTPPTVARSPSRPAAAAPR